MVAEHFYVLIYKVCSASSKSINFDGRTQSSRLTIFNNKRKRRIIFAFFIFSGKLFANIFATASTLKNCAYAIRLTTAGWLVDCAGATLKMTVERDSGYNHLIADSGTVPQDANVSASAEGAGRSCSIGPSPHNSQPLLICG